MRPSSNRLFLKQLLVSLLFVAFANLCSAQILEWRSGAFANTAGSQSSGTSEGVATVMAPSPIKEKESFSFLTGHFRGDLFFPQIDALKSVNQEDIFLASFLHTNTSTPVQNVQWIEHIYSAGGSLSRVNAIDYSKNGQVAICGFFDEKLFFQVNDIDLAGDAKPLGFVAIFDASNGALINAYTTSELEPVDIKFDNKNNIYISTDKGTIAKYDEAGNSIWDNQYDSYTFTKIAVSCGEKTFLYAASPVESGGNHFLTRLDPSDGTIIWERLAEGRSIDIDTDLLYNVRLLKSVNTEKGEFVFVEFVTLQEQTLWDKILLTPTDTKTIIQANAIAVDPQGLSHVALSLDGEFNVEGVDRIAVKDAAVVSIDRDGIVFDFNSSNASKGQATGISVDALSHTNINLAGTYNDVGFQFPSSAVRTNNPNAYFAQLRPLTSVGPPIQQRFTVSLSPSQLAQGVAISLMRDRIAQLGGQAYLEINQPVEGTVLIAAMLTQTQFNLLVEDGFFVRSDPLVQPNGEAGTGSDLSSALTRINTGITPTMPNPEYSYPCTFTRTYLYVLDTELRTPSWLPATDSEITDKAEIRFIGAGPSLSSKTHGDDMMSLVASPNFGAAPATPMDITNFDIYSSVVPDPEEVLDASPVPVTTLSAVIKAIYDATDTHLSDAPELSMGTILIASSGAKPAIGEPSAEEISMEQAIAYANSNGLLVIVSAGNDSGDTNNYLPAAFGDFAKSGLDVLCVGGIQDNGTWYANSNQGTAIGMVAPGRDVPVSVSGGSSLTRISGTSASAAFATSAALIHQSSNPLKNPTQILADLISLAHTHSNITVGQRELKITAAGVPFDNSIEKWTKHYLGEGADLDLDGDMDGKSAFEEFLEGTNPLEPDDFSSAPLTAESQKVGDKTQILLSQPVAWNIINESDPLNMGSVTLSFFTSSTLENFDTKLSSPSLSLGDTKDGLRPIQVTISPGAKDLSGFYRSKFVNK